MHFSKLEKALDRSVHDNHHGKVEVLRRDLIRYGYEAPSSKDLGYYLSRGFYVMDWVMINSLLEGESEPNWHYVTFYPGAGEVTRLFDPYNVTFSFEDAIAFLVYAHDLGGLDVTEIKPSDDGGIVLMHQEELVARIGCVVWPEVTEQQSRRATNVLKGLHRTRDPELIKRRFRSLPGIQDLNSTVESLPGRGVDFPVWHRTPANWRDQLRGILNLYFGLDVDLSTTQELTARYFGFENWHHLVARFKSAGCLHQPYMVLDKSTDHENVVFYRDVASALWGYSRKVTELVRSKGLTDLFVTSHRFSQLVLFGDVGETELDPDLMLAPAPIEEGGDRYKPIVESLLNNPGGVSQGLLLYFNKPGEGVILQ